MRFVILLLALALAPRAHAQKASDHVRLGIAAHRALKPEDALRHFQAALAVDSLNYDANCRAALAAADVVRQRPDDRSDPDGLYALANRYARRAVTIDSTKAEGHLLVALTLGFISLGQGPMERLSSAGEIWREVNKAIALDPKDDRAYHVLARWHAELSRFAWAKSIIRANLGAIADSASWEGAIANLERAVELNPSFIYHRLDLAETYLAVQRPDDARVQLEKIEALPVTEVRDTSYKAEAKRLLDQMKA